MVQFKLDQTTCVFCKILVGLLLVLVFLLSFGNHILSYPRS